MIILPMPQEGPPKSVVHVPSGHADPVLIAPPFEEGLIPMSFELLEPQPMAASAAIIKHTLRIMVTSN
jgi:hypothetical protein